MCSQLGIFKGDKPPIQNLQKIDLGGRWKYILDPDDVGIREKYFMLSSYEEFPEMRIPSNWFLNGADSYPERGQEIDYSGVMWFQREFEVPQKIKGSLVELVFMGVDYFAEVWLNGQNLGSHEGYFQPFSFDVSSLLDYHRPNNLVVRVESPREGSGDEWYMHKRLIKGIFGHHDARPGGAWGAGGQEYNTGGIWNEVFLESSGLIKIKGLKVMSRLDGDHKSAQIKVRMSVFNHLREDREVRFDLAVRPYNFSGEKLRMSFCHSLIPGQNEVRMEFSIQDPKLWWTWDRGHPNLYLLRVELRDGESQEIFHVEEELFGVRSIRVDERDYSWYLNGERIFPRGTNYISSQWLSEMNKQKFDRDLRMMREANLNAVRVHAHVEPKEFYHSADCYGLLVWQDFPLQWAYTDDEEFSCRAVRQLEDMIELLYNHPSIAVWCIHNESPWSAPWMAERTSSYDPEQNLLLDRKLYNKALKLDRTRYVHINSGTGDSHVYPGWYYGSYRDFSNLPGAPFPTEFGCQALPEVESLKKFILPENLWPLEEENLTIWEFHNLQIHELFQVAEIKGDSIEELIQNSQKYQAQLLKYAIERYRLAKYEKISGLFQFMFSDCWPSVTWSVVDYYRKPKEGYWALKSAFQPVLPIAIIENSSDNCAYARIYVVNDLSRDVQGLLKWRLEGNQGVLSKGQERIFIPKDSSKEYFKIELPSPFSQGENRLVLALYDSKEDLIAEN